MRTRYAILVIFLLMSGPYSKAQTDSVRAPQQVRTDGKLDAAQQAVNYTLDLKNSKLLWKAKKVNGGHNGYVLFQSGGLKVSPAGKPLNGEFRIHMNSIVVVDQLMPKDNREVESVVKAGNFFAVSLYPTARMRVSKIAAAGKANQYKVTGDLTIKGVTKPLEFLAVIIRKGNTLNADASFKINRTKWGINYKSGSIFGNLKDELIEDDIEISLKMYFVIPEGC